MAESPFPTDDAAEQASSVNSSGIALDTAARLRVLKHLRDGGENAHTEFERLTRLARQFLSADHADIVTIDSSSQQSLAVESTLDAAPPPHLALNLRVVRTGKTLAITDLPKSPSESPAQASSGHDAYLGVPLRSPDGFVVGCFFLLSQQSREWSEAEVELIEELTEVAQSEIARRLENQAAEAQIKASQDRISKVLGWADCLLWEAEVDCTRKDWDWTFNVQPSGLYNRLFGSRIPPRNGGLWYRMEIPEQAEMDRRSREAMLTGSKGYTQEFRIIDKGNTHWLRETVTINSIGQNKFWIVGVATDITHLKKLEAELANARDEAVQASRIKSQFLANMSHEIRTPMNGILGMANLLTESKLDADQNRMAGVIRKSGESLLDIINDILDISKIEAGKLVLETTTFDLGQMLRDLHELLQPTAAANGLEFSLQLPSDFPQAVAGDPVRIRQIMTNLVGNALKFTLQGSVRVDATVARPRQDQVALRIQVSDTGPGVPADRQATLFEPFVQADNSDSRRHGGTGLGLSISQQLAEMMGGNISLRSAVNQGSEFSFEVELPEKRVMPGGSVPTPIDLYPQTGPAQGRLLLVEDNPNNQVVAEMMLKRVGVDFDIASNGEEALATLAKNSYALILMDCQMPVLDGYETTRRIRQENLPGTNARIPIVALTAYAMSGDAERCLRAGMNGYLTKPIQKDKLNRTLIQYGLLDPTSPSPSPEASPLIDLDLLEEYREIPGRKHANLREELLRGMADELPRHIASLESQIAEKQAQPIAETAHILAGIAANVGARSVHGPMLNLESEALDEQWPKVRQIWNDARPLLHQMRDDVERAIRLG